MLELKNFFKFFFGRYYRKYMVGLSGSGGRNLLGRVCVYHKGAGNKRRCRLVDRFRRVDSLGIVLRVFRTHYKHTPLGAILYDNGLFSFVTLSHGVSLHGRLYSGSSSLLDATFASTGSAFLLKHFGLFSVISSFELFPFSGFKVARAPGTSAYISAKVGPFVILRATSGWQLRVSEDALAVMGMCANPFLHFEVLRKAGKHRALGVRPAVRGVVKNPCDHPHGGGEGRGSPPAAAVSPWGKLTKGTPTTNKKKDRLQRRLFKHIF